MRSNSYSLSHVRRAPRMESISRLQESRSLGSALDAASGVADAAEDALRSGAGADALAVVSRLLVGVRELCACAAMHVRVVVFVVT